MVVTITIQLLAKLCIKACALFVLTQLNEPNVYIETIYIRTFFALGSYCAIHQSALTMQHTDVSFTASYTVSLIILAMKFRVDIQQNENVLMNSSKMNRLLNVPYSHQKTSFEYHCSENVKQFSCQIMQSHLGWWHFLTFCCVVN